MHATKDPAPRMSAHAFRNWLQAMKRGDDVRTDGDCADLLGLSRSAVLAMKYRGADHRTALACAALHHRIPAWSEGGTFHE